jgi:hypothetical protein
MLPLAVSGPAIIGVVVLGALVLVWLLLRLELRDDADERGEDREP